jgi:hypothetical protein
MKSKSTPNPAITAKKDRKNDFRFKPKTIKRFKWFIEHIRKECPFDNGRYFESYYQSPKPRLHEDNGIWWAHSLEIGAFLILKGFDCLPQLQDNGNFTLRFTDSKRLQEVAEKFFKGFEVVNVREFVAMFEILQEYRLMWIDHERECDRARRKKLKMERAKGLGSSTG